MFDPSMLDRQTIAPERVRGLRRVEFEHLATVGLLADERVELLHGELVEMSPQGAIHLAVTARIAAHLIRQLPDTVYVLSHSSLALRAWPDSMPEPDVAVVPALTKPDYPRAASLVVEVARTSLRKDRDVKAALYARGRIPVYWLVDLAAGQVIVMSAPRRGRYTRERRLGPGQVLTLPGRPRVRIPVAAVVATPDQLARGETPATMAAARARRAARAARARAARAAVSPSASAGRARRAGRRRRS